MNTDTLPADTPVTAFDQQRLVARGPLAQVLDIVARYEAREAGAHVVVFDDASGAVIAHESLIVSAGPGPRAVVAAAAEPRSATPRPGRPRLGVVAREVTLLPEQWQWLAAQPGGASAALRRLIDEARDHEDRRERRHLAHRAAWQCLAVLGQGLTGADDALMAIYNGDASRFDQSSVTWPVDVRDYLRDLGFGGVRGS